jgi:suppressor of ftsI/bilirubin oxidase
MRAMPSLQRRTLLKALSAMGLSLSPHVRAQRPGDGSGMPACTARARSRLAGASGETALFRRLAPGDAVLALDAITLPKSARQGGLTLAYRATHRGRQYLNPTLVLNRGQRLRVAFTNRIDQPTIVHWHGLSVDTRNDGAGMIVVAPGERYDYDFEVRNRAATYWYHPHPHGMTAGQAYHGLFGMIEVDDAEQRRLRRALDLRPGRSEFTLLLQDRRSEAYEPSDSDRVHGYFGERVLVNASECPTIEVPAGSVRLRLLNASNARTYLLGLRTTDGATLPFTMIGSDGGLLGVPVACRKAFLASAERIDCLVDLSARTPGEVIVLETLAFDPMHMEMTAAPSPSADAHAAGHSPAPVPRPVDHSAMHHDGSFAEGAARALAIFRVHGRSGAAVAMPATLSTIAPIALDGASERPLRLGYAKGRWRINDRVFAMGETPIEVARDAREVWLIRNYFTSMPHAMHIHGFHFQVLGRETSPEQVAALRVDDSGRLATDLGWKDTVLVWPGESVRVAIDFAMPFAGPQTYMVHCHNLEHEDGGMMLGMKVG